MTPSIRLRLRHQVLLAFGLSCALAGGVRAAPVSTAVELVIQISDEMPIRFSGSGVVSVSGSTVMVPAGLIAASKIVVPVSAVTAYGSPLSLVNLSNAAGTFRLGGVTSQASAEVCPGSGSSPSGFACNAGGGIGGSMALTGTLIVPIVPSIIVVPFVLGDMGIGQGGSTNIPFPADGAAWSTGPGVIGTANDAISVSAGAGSPLTLVSPIFIAGSPLNGGWGDLFSFTATLTLANVHLAPEPDSLLLLAAGVIGLVLLLRGRRGD